jgi:hypothetical protein
MNREQSEDLEWLAFRYVAAELSPAESREFEDRLEHDQEAREAVGRLVEVTCAVRTLDWDTAPPVRHVRRVSPWHRRRSVQLIAGLALGLIVALLVWGRRSGDRASLREGSLATAPQAAELAVVWSNARAELSGREDDAAGWRWLTPADKETDDPGPAVEEAAADTPDWMVSAVSTMESDDDDQPSPASDVEGI